MQNGPRIEAKGDAAEVERLLSSELRRVSAADSGWRLLYRRDVDGSLWELSYPHSEMHGGGPRLLVELEIADPTEWR